MLFAYRVLYGPRLQDDEFDIVQLTVFAGESTMASVELAVS